MSTSPHFLFVPGGWATTKYWNPVRDLLKSAGYASSAVALASNNVKKGITDFALDINVIQSAIGELVDRGLNVVVVPHSYCSFIACEAVKDLSKSNRSAHGLSGGVVRIVMIAGFVVPEGFQAENSREHPCPIFAWMTWDKENDTLYVTNEDAEKFLYNDMPKSTAQDWAKKTVTWSNAMRWRTCTYAGWRYVPITYVKCLRDETPFGVWSPMMLEQARTVTPNMLDTVEEVDAGHCPMLSCPEEFVGILKKTAKACE